MTSFSRYDTLFEDYLVNIALTKQQAENIDQKLSETLSLFLTEYEGDVEIYAQGSFAMGTTVRPLTENQSANGAGEYDVDIALERTAWGYAQDALQSIRNTLEAEYGDMVDRKLRESCERVHHDIDDQTGIGFHADYVPIKLINARNAAERSANTWFPSDTKKLVEWFGELSEAYTFLPASILILKRIRDYAGLTDDLPSICITALACKYYSDQDSYADDLLSVINQIVVTLSVPHDQLSIQIEPIEDDLAVKITVETQVKLLDFFRHCQADLKTAFEAGNIDLVRQYLSGSFPSEMTKYPEVLTPLRSRKLGIEFDGSLNIKDINEDNGKGSRLSRIRRKFFGAGDRLIFRASQYDKHQYGIRWQVLNSVEAPLGKRRGNLFKARGADGVEGSSPNKFVNHETEQYNGEHWIKYYVYNKSSHRVVEIGRKFFVE